MAIWNKIRFNYTGSSQSVVLPKGFYQIECWGASGGGFLYNGVDQSGRGAYTSGKLFVLSSTTLYVYVGQKGEVVTGYLTTLPSTFNGGGKGGIAENSVNTHHGSSGGGATDIRLLEGSSWLDSGSLNSRIMVSAGGGGATSIYGTTICHGGFGGSLTGGPGVHAGTGNGITDALGGNQNSGGTGGTGAFCNGKSGSLGIGGDWGGCFAGSGGGGGYYGGGGSAVVSGNHQCGAGGSSYISGYPGTISVGYSFHDPIMISGNQEMISPYGLSETGHIGNGYAIISNLNYFDSTFCNILNNSLFIIFTYTFLVISHE